VFLFETKGIRVAVQLVLLESLAKSVFCPCILGEYGDLLGRLWVEIGVTKGGLEVAAVVGHYLQERGL